MIQILVLMLLILDRQEDIKIKSINKLYRKKFKRQK